MSCVTEIASSLAHHRDIYRRSSANKERLRLRRIRGKLACPRRLEIKRVRKDEPRCFIQRSSRDEIAYSLVCLVCDPFVNVLCNCGRIRNEINRLECAAEILFHQRQESFTKRIARLRKQPVSNIQCDRFSWATEFLGLFYELSRLYAHFLERMLQRRERGKRAGIISKMQNSLHLSARVTIGAGECHGQRGFD